MKGWKVVTPGMPETDLGGLVNWDASLGEVVFAILDGFATIRRSVWDGAVELTPEQCREVLAEIVDEANYLIAYRSMS